MSQNNMLLDAALELREAVNALNFAPPVAAVYNPLDYAWDAYAEYTTRFGNGHKRVVFLGMNPGPFGMTQTGVPFGEIATVRDWLKIAAFISGRTGRPEHEHPAYPVTGINCTRSEVSGRRLWGLFASRFGTPENFFAQHFVTNYCPLVFIADSRRSQNKIGGKNLTPDHLPATERKPLFDLCNRHLLKIINALNPEYLVGIGAFAEARIRETLELAPAMKKAVKVLRILHPSPASPLSNHDWPGTVTQQLTDAGVWA